MGRVTCKSISATSSLEPETACEDEEVIFVEIK